MKSRIYPYKKTTGEICHENLVNYSKNHYFRHAGSKKHKVLKSAQARQISGQYWLGEILQKFKNGLR